MQLDQYPLRKITLFSYMFATLCSLLCLTGCGSGSLPTVDFTLSGTTLSEESPGEPDLYTSAKAAPIVNQESHAPTLPYPDRTDPFEFLVEVETPENESAATSQSSVRLLGILGEKDLRAFLRVGDETKLLHIGQQWRNIAVVSISPPTVLLIVDGTQQQFSLLGHTDAH